MTTTPPYHVAISQDGASDSQLFAKNYFRNGNTLLLSAVFNSQTKTGQTISSHYETLLPVRDMDKISDTQIAALKKSFEETLGKTMSNFTTDFYGRLDDRNIKSMAHGNHLFMPFIIRAVTEKSPNTMQQHWYAMITTSEMFRKKIPELLGDNALNIAKICDYRVSKVTIG